MKIKEITRLVQNQLANLSGFENYHGVTNDNLSDYLVEPFSVIVDPDDLETEERDMWVVLDPPGEYLVAYDPLLESWAVIETKTNNKFIQVVAGQTLAEALDGM